MTFSPAPQAVRRGGVAAAAAALFTVAVCAVSAQAGVVETPNACKFTYDSEYRTQGVEMTASAPTEATPGQPFTLSGEKLEVKLRPQLAQDAAQAGLIPSSPGGTESTIVTKTWLAIRATNTSEGTQVIGPLTISATATAYFDEAGQTITATPFTYTPPALPDTTWTATGGDIAFSQAGPGAITAAAGQLPVGPGGSSVTVGGSAVVQANLPGGVNFYMDCQPGETIVTRPPAAAGVSFNALVAGPFANVAVAGPASNPAGVPAKRPEYAVASASTRRLSGRFAAKTLVAKRGKVRLRISCPAGGADCAGRVRVRTRTPVRIGRRSPALLNLARTLPYELPAGKKATVTLVLNADARALLRTRRKLGVRVTLAPAKGRSFSQHVALRSGLMTGLTQVG